MDEVAQALAEHPFVRALNREQIAWLASCARRREFAPGEFLVREGTEAGSLYLIRRGRVSLEVHLPDRGTLQVESLRDGDIVGISWLFPGRRVQLDARAIEPVEVLALDALCVRAKMDADHDLAWALAQGMLFEMYQRLARVRMQRLDLYAAEPRSTP